MLFYILISIAFADQPKTTITGESHVRYHHREDHLSTKFKWDTWTMCWKGKSSTEDKESGPLKGSFESKESQGTWQQQANLEGPLQRMITQKVNWESEFTDDYTFHIKIVREKQSDIHQNEAGNCVTHDWDYKIDNDTLNVNSSVEIAVPDNIYLVRIMEKSNFDSNGSELFNSSISNIINIPIKPDLAVNKPLSMSKIRNYHYFFTQPGDNIKLEFNYNDAMARNIEIISDIEVTFMGFNRCEQATQAALNGKPLSEENISKSLKDFVTNYEKKTMDEIHNELLFISCLTQKKSVESLLYRNNASQILAILNGIYDFNKETKGSNKKDQFSEIIKNILSNMSRYALSRSLFNQLRPLCTTMYPYFYRQTGMLDSFIRGYAYINEKMMDINNAYGNSLIQKSPISVGYLTTYYQNILEKLKKISQNYQKYSELSANKENSDHMEELGNDYLNEDKSNFTHQILVTFQYFPPLKPTEEIVKLMSTIEALDDQTHRIHDLFFDEFSKFTHQEENAINYTVFEQEIEKLKNIELEFYKSFRNLYSWIGGDVSKNFTDSISDINVSHYSPSDDFLKNSYRKADGSGFLEPFRKSFFETSNDENVFQDFISCLHGYYQNFN